MPNKSSLKPAPNHFAGMVLPEQMVARLRHDCARGLVVFAGPVASGVVSVAARVFKEVFPSGHLVNHDQIAEGAGNWVAAVQAGKAKITWLSLAMHLKAPSVFAGEIRTPEELGEAELLTSTNIPVFITLRADGTAVGVLHRLRALAGGFQDYPLTVIGVTMAPGGKPREQVALLDIVFEAERFLRRPMPGLEIPLQEIQRRLHPRYRYARHQHARFLLQVRKLANLPEFIDPRETHATRLASPVEVLRKLKAPEEIRPLEMTNELRVQFYNLISVGWSAAEIAARLVAAGFDTTAEGLQAAVDDAKPPQRRNSPKRSRPRRTKRSRVRAR